MRRFLGSQFARRSFTGHPEVQYHGTKTTTPHKPWRVLGVYIFMYDRGIGRAILSDPKSMRIAMTNVLQIKAVMKKTTLSRAEVARWGKDHCHPFPAPISLNGGPIYCGWLEHEVDAWLESLPRVYRGGVETIF